MVQRVCDEVSNPLCYHDTRHDGQQELDIICDLHLKTKANIYNSFVEVSKLSHTNIHPLYFAGAYKGLLAKDESIKKK